MLIKVFLLHKCVSLVRIFQEIIMRNTFKNIRGPVKVNKRMIFTANTYQVPFSKLLLTKYMVMQLL